MNQDIEIFTSKIKDFKSVYLAGGIQNKTRPDQWRQDLKEFFEKNGIKVYNPVEDNAHIFNPSIMGYKEDETSYTLEELQYVNEEKEAMLLRQTEENDMHFISKSDLLVFYLDESAGFGTHTEFKDNYDNFKKPVIIIRTIARKNIRHWVKWRRYKSLVHERSAIEFKSLTEMKDFLIANLSFKAQ